MSACNKIIDEGNEITSTGINRQKKANDSSLANNAINVSFDLISFLYQLLYLVKN